MEPLDQHDPRRVGPFEVLGRLGKGGMGLVYLGRSAAGRRVAIKTVRAELAEDALFRARFEREIKAAHKVGGFYTAAVVDADAHAPVPWLATAYVPAPSLEDLVVATGPLPTGAVRWLAAGIAEALQSIHRAELVHRDLKPSNVLVVEDGPRVIDFGIAAGGQYTRVTMTNVAVGTPAYMSPEQARNSRGVTGPSDVFSLGSTLVYAATGHAPYRGSGPVDIVGQLLNREPDLSGLPDELRPLIKACLRHEINRRPTPADLQAELAPHLFSSAESAGGAAVWLPAKALDFIEARSDRRIPRQDPPRQEPPRPARLERPELTTPPPGPRPLDPRPGSGHGPGVEEQQQGGDPSKIRNAVQEAAKQAALTSSPPAVLPGSGPVPGPDPHGSAHSAHAAHAPSGHAPSAHAPLPPMPPLPPPPAPHSMHPVRLASGVSIGPGPEVPAPGLYGAGSAAVQETPPPDWARPAVPAADPASPPAGFPAVHQHPSAAVPMASPVPMPAPVPTAPPPAHRAVPEPRYQRPADWRPWRFRMSNDVWGSPLAWGGAIYVSSFEVHALELDSGQRRYKSGSPVWTMKIADGLVHTADGHSLFTFDAAGGEPRWQLTAGGWIFALRAAGGAVLAGTRGGGVQAWDALDGTPWWQTADAQSSFEFPHSGPEIFGQVACYHGAAAGGLLLRGADLRTGTPLWAVPVGGAAPLRPTSSADSATVYVAAGPCLFAVDAGSGAVLWRFDAAAEIRTPPTVVDGHGQGEVCVADAAGGVYAVGAADGRVRWQSRIEGRPAPEAPVFGSGVLMVTAGPSVFALDALDGRNRWRFDAKAAVVGSPAFADGLAHIGSRDHRLYTVQADSGRLRWRLETGGEITGTPVASGGTVCVCSSDNCVYALDAAKGTNVRQ